MAQQREATTDHLVGIIASIKMERRSGRLTVRRGEGPTLEEGTLVFVRGQMTEAQVGRRNNADALNWLSTWGRARYIFVPLDGGKTPIGGLGPIPITSPSKITSPLSPARATTSVHTDRLGSGSSPMQGSGVPRVAITFTEATACIDRAGLSRAHKHLYLLIDGRRTVLELVPLVGRKVEEVRNMLHDLEWLGVVRVESAPPPSEP